MDWRRKFNAHLGPSFLRGLRLTDWFRLLWDNRLRVSPRYLPRALSVTGVSAFNSVFSALEEARYRTSWEGQEVAPPLFIMGMGRSGTTHLFQLLAHDPRFGFPNTYQVSFPHAFLTTERFVSPLLSNLVSPHRIQDKVKVTLETPAEDELALMAMTGMSPLLGRIFPNNREQYVRFRSFREASFDEREKWKRALFTFCQKLTLRYGRPLLLKSPVHTCRVALILELFPDARFLHIHRHPYDVLRSQLHSRAVTSLNWRLQSVKDETRTERALGAFEDISNCFLSDKALLKENQLCEIAYSDLVADRMGTLSKAYSVLGLPDFEAARPAIQAFVESLKSYERNVHEPLTPEVKEQLQARLSHWMHEYGYQE